MGFTLDGTNRFTILHVTDDDIDVYLSEMKLVNGNWETDGGAILNEGNFYLSDMIFINNKQIGELKSWTNLKDIEISIGTIDIRN